MNVSGTWHKPVLLQRCLWGTGGAAPRTPTLVARAVCLTMKPVGEPYAGNPHVRFDERGWETERCRMAQATAPIKHATVQRAKRAGVKCRPAQHARASPVR